MKNKKIKPTRSRFNVLRQICNLIPGHEVSKIARETSVEDMSRTFSPWSHTVSLLDAQLGTGSWNGVSCTDLQIFLRPHFRRRIVAAINIRHRGLSKRPPFGVFLKHFCRVFCWVLPEIEILSFSLCYKLLL